MCCPNGLAKWFLIIFNAFFLVMGIVTLALGAFVLADDSAIKEAFSYFPTNDIVSSDDVDDVLDGTSFLDSACYAIIAMGALLFILAFFAICGAMKADGKCGKMMLFIYGFIVLLFLIIEIAIAIFAILYADDAKDYLKTFLVATITYVYAGEDIDGNDDLVVSSDLLTSTWDLVQVKFECCGANGVSDYTSAEVWDDTQYSVSGSAINPALSPPTCCVISSGKGNYPNGDLTAIVFSSMTDCLTSSAASHTNDVGCLDSIMDELKSYSWYIVGGTGAFAFFQFCAICAAFRLIHLHNKSRVADFA